MHIIAIQLITFHNNKAISYAFFYVIIDYLVCNIIFIHLNSSLSNT